MKIHQRAIAVAGYSVQADWYDVGAAQSLLMLPGYQSAKARQKDIATQFANANMNVLVVDYSGHGESPFKLDETRPGQHLLEVVSVFDWLRKTRSDDRLCVMGTSYGGFLAAYLAHFRDFDKLLLRTPAIYRPEDLYTFSHRIAGAETRQYRKNAAAVEEHPIFVRTPVFTGHTLVVTHGQDEDVPRTTTEAYSNAFRAKAYVAGALRHSARDPANSLETVQASYDYMRQWLSE